MEEYICKYCGKVCKNKNSLVQHEIRCKENPNRIVNCGNHDATRGYPAWNKGLTKQNDPIVAKYANTYKEIKYINTIKIFIFQNLIHI